MNNEDIVSLMERYKRELLEFEKRNTAPEPAKKEAETAPVSAQKEEKAEQAKLRREYIDSVVGNLRSQLDNTYVVEGDKKIKLERVEKPEKDADGEPAGSPNKSN